uniref:Uncharacterized protein n=1 Tax=uncultured prokaryote TaxID=198431 RepID=A0A0H5Q2J3_9ZZZZ|nr:hypothetical protein [uncultured prokaryote]
MANYRIQVEHARYWRGQPHRWSTVYHFNLAAARAPIDASACDAFAAAEKPLLYPGGTTSNGISSISIYGPSGGTPIAAKTYFDWHVPASWVNAGIGAAWTGASGPLATAEVALVVKSPTQLSRTGKPVFLRKWYHGVPAINDGATAEVTSSQITAITAAFVALGSSLTATYGLVYASPSGAVPGTPTVQPFFGNHQMPRGRKRKVVTIDGKQYVPANNGGQLPIPIEAA